MVFSSPISSESGVKGPLYSLLMTPHKPLRKPSSRPSLLWRALCDGPLYAYPIAHNAVCWSTGEAASTTEKLTSSPHCVVQGGGPVMGSMHCSSWLCTQSNSGPASNGVECKEAHPANGIRNWLNNLLSFGWLADSREARVTNRKGKLTGHNFCEGL